MGHQGKTHLVIADVDVGMVTGLFGEFPDLVDEDQRLSEVLEKKCPDELTGFDLPVWYGD